MITAIVRFRLPEGTTRDDAKAMFEKSAPNYRGVPGLVRKYYLYGDDRTGGGVYLWNSREATPKRSSSYLSLGPAQPKTGAGLFRGLHSRRTAG